MTTINNIKTGTIIQLTPEQIAEANACGVARHMNNRKEGVHLDINNGRNGNREVVTAEDMTEYDKRGARAEFAFALLTNMDQESWDTIKAIGKQSASQGLDDGDGWLDHEDIRLSVDVKSTSGHRSNMLVSFNKLGKKSTADVFVLLIEDADKEGCFRFAGAIDRFTMKHNIKAGSYRSMSRDTWWIPSHYLYSLSDAIGNCYEYLETNHVDNALSALKGN